MKLGDLGEFGLIRRITRESVVDGAHVVKGIGDDCSVTTCRADLLRLVTTDLLIERVHFLRGAITPRQLGAKALAVNLSDIAAMGGSARDAYVCLALPDDLTVEYVEEMYRGLKGTAAAFSVNLLGGDTTASKADLVVSVTVTGEVEPDAVLYRSGARPGDRIYLTGPVGDSGAGFHALLDHASGCGVDELVRRHLEPVPHLVQGRVIAAARLAHAMIDVSDGVGVDLSHLCEESGVGAILHEDALPISPELAAYSRHLGLDPTSFALGGGEDYVLLLTGEDSLGSVAAAAGVRLFEVGRIIEEPRMSLRRADGSVSPLEPRGWDHFKRTDPLR